MEQSETQRDLFGKVKSLNDKPRVSSSHVFIEKTFCVIDIIRNIVLFAFQNRSKSNDCHRCKRMNETRDNIVNLD